MATERGSFCKRQMSLWVRRELLAGEVQPAQGTAAGTQDEGVAAELAAGGHFDGVRVHEACLTHAGVDLLRPPLPGGR